MLEPVDLIRVPDPVIYAPHLARLSACWANPRAVLAMAIRDRRPIEIYRDGDFRALFHALDQMPARYRESK